MHSYENQFPNDILTPHDVMLTLHPNNYFTLQFTLCNYIPPTPHTWMSIPIKTTNVLHNSKDCEGVQLISPKI